MGDLNPEIDYKGEVVAAGDTDPPTLFFNKTQELCLFQHISDVTRVRQNQTPTILEYVFTDQENLIDSVAHEAPLGKSDHMVLTWELLLETHQLKSTQVKFNYHEGDYQIIQSSLLSANDQLESAVEGNHSWWNVDWFNRDIDKFGYCSCPTEKGTKGKKKKITQVDTEED